MRQELQNLIHQLQKEKCPPAVLTNVSLRVPSRRSRIAWRRAWVWSVSTICLVGALLLWQRTATRQSERRAEAARQTQEAFGYISMAIMRAATHTENALLKEAVPPLRDSFETVRNRVNKAI